MSGSHLRCNRRGFVRGLGFGAMAFMTPGAFAEALTPTSPGAEGPFYPDKLPLDTDNDLLIINDSITPAVGEITHLSGKVVDRNGTPMRNAVVEIWQVDANGVYIHTESAERGKPDANFQGFGRFLTNAKGEYYFRTIKPRSYSGRTPHIHFAVNRGDKRILTTQMYIQGEPKNENDFLFRKIRDQQERESVLVDFKPLKDSKVGELTAEFDIVIGHTPDET